MEEEKYEEVGNNYRFFLGWRHAAFAGDLIIIYGVLSFTFSIDKDFRSIAWLIPLFSSLIGVILWIIDVRTRDLYHAAITAGKKLEGATGGFYTELSKIALQKKDKFFKRKTQTLALFILFIGSSIFLMALAIYLLILWN